MTKTLRILRAGMAVILVCCLFGAVFSFGAMTGHLQARDQQQEVTAASAKPTPTPKTDKATPAPSLKLSQEEINAAAPLWNELQAQQREHTIAIAGLRKAAKKPNDKDGHSLAVLALNAVLENADQAQGRWNEWMTGAQTRHDCKDCQIDLQKWEFIRFPTAVNTPK